jgi:hypothetical protein
MSSGRKFSVDRHINNYNFHKGAGEVIPFVQYAIGIKDRRYQGGRESAISSPRSRKFHDRIFAKISIELEQLVAKEIAAKIYHERFENKTELENIKVLAVEYILRKIATET